MAAIFVSLVLDRVDNGGVNVHAEVSNNDVLDVSRDLR